MAHVQHVDNMFSRGVRRFIPLHHFDNCMKFRYNFFHRHKTFRMDG